MNHFPKAASSAELQTTLVATGIFVSTSVSVIQIGKPTDDQCAISGSVPLDAAQANAFRILAS